MIILLPRNVNTNADVGILAQLKHKKTPMQQKTFARHQRDLRQLHSKQKIQSFEFVPVGVFIKIRIEKINNGNLLSNIFRTSKGCLINVCETKKKLFEKR